MTAILSDPALMAEYALASGLFQDPDLIRVYGSRLNKQDFENKICGVLWDIARIREHNGQSFAFYEVWQDHREVIEQVADADALVSILNGFYGKASVDKYIAAIEDKKAKKKLSLLQRRIETSLQDPYALATDIWDEIEHEINSLAPTAPLPISEQRKEDIAHWVNTVSDRYTHRGRLLLGYRGGHNESRV